jgi:hypothetical protein
VQAPRGQKYGKLTYCSGRSRTRHVC